MRIQFPFFQKGGNIAISSTLVTVFIIFFSGFVNCIILNGPTAIAVWNKIGCDGYQRFRFCFDYIHSSSECRSSEKIGWNCAWRVYTYNRDGIQRNSCDQKAAFLISCFSVYDPISLRQVFARLRVAPPL